MVLSKFKQYFTNYRNEIKFARNRKFSETLNFFLYYDVSLLLSVLLIIQLINFTKTPWTTNNQIGQYKKRSLQKFSERQNSLKLKRIYNDYKNKLRNLIRKSKYKNYENHIRHNQYNTKNNRKILSHQCYCKHTRKKSELA